MAFRPITPLTAFTDNQGQPLAGGSILFYDAGTTTPKNVYSDSGLTTNLGAAVELDSAGRPLATNIWGSGSYRVRLYDADNVLIDEADPVSEEGASGVTFPSQSGHAGEFLTTDGSTLSWDAIRQVPDPTGNNNKILSTDGESLIWIPKPSDGADGVSDITVASGSFKAGNHYVQWGTSTCTASGANSASKAVSFPTTFTSVQVAFVQVNAALVNGICGASTGVTSLTTSGFTANFDVADRHSYASFLTADIPFYWVAIGTKT